MDIQVKIWLRDGHVWDFCCDQDDAILLELVSALPGAAGGAHLPADGVIQIEARTGERLFLVRSSLVAVLVLPIANELSLSSADRFLKINHSSVGHAAVVEHFLTEQGRHRDLCEIRFTHSHPNSPLIDFAIITVPRPADYVHQLIASLRNDLPLRLVVGTPECDYLKAYQDNPFITIFEAPALEWHRFRECGIHQRAAWNYWRALSIGRSQPYSNGLVILEDDVIPAREWEHRLFRTIEQIEMYHSGPYILALYAPAGAPLGEAEDGKLFVSYPACSFFGSQAIYYPEPARQGFSMYLKENALETFRNPYDFLLRDYAQEEKVPIFAAVPCLFQHIGEVSTGLAQFFHQAHRFDG